MSARGTWTSSIPALAQFQNIAEHPAFCRGKPVSLGSPHRARSRGRRAASRLPAEHGAHDAPEPGFALARDLARPLHRNRQIARRFVGLGWRRRSQAWFYGCQPKSRWRKGRQCRVAPVYRAPAAPSSRRHHPIRDRSPADAEIHAPRDGSDDVKGLFRFPPRAPWFHRRWRYHPISFGCTSRCQVPGKTARWWACPDGATAHSARVFQHRTVSSTESSASRRSARRRSDRAADDRFGCVRVPQRRLDTDVHRRSCRYGHYSSPSRLRAAALS